MGYISDFCYGQCLINKNLVKKNDVLRLPSRCLEASVYHQKMGYGSLLEILVRYITDLREITKKDYETLLVAPTATVETVLKILSEKYGPRFRRYLYDAGHLRSELHVLVNHMPLRQLQSFQIPLTNNDEITSIPTFFPVSGG